MLSPRGGRPHDAASASSPSPRHTGTMGGDDHDAGAYGRVLEWERGLPAPSELTPLSHRLISPALAAAFRIRDPAGAYPPPASSFDGGGPLAHDSPTSHLSFRRDEEDDDDDGDEEEGEGETDDPAPGSGGGGRAAGKKARMVWTPELHHRFVQAVAHLGDKGAVPKAIVRLMNVDGLTRENVASHLQKYRLYLKRTRATAAPTPRSLPQGYGSHFRPQRLPDTSDRSSYCALLPRDKELERERDQALQAMGWKRTKDL